MGPHPFTRIVAVLAGSPHLSRSVTGFAAKRCDHSEKVLREYYREVVSEADAAKYCARARNRFTTPEMDKRPVRASSGQVADHCGG